MAIHKCRICGNKFFTGTLLKYKNMPKAAQFLPDKNSLKNDKGIDLKVCQCSGCGLVQLSNEPVSYFREVVRASAFSPEMKNFRTRQFKDFVQKFSLKGKKVVEIGCGRGEYLALMKQAGADAYGLEYSKESARQCRKNGLKVSKGFIKNENFKLKDALFDAFFILSFFEHLPDPNSTLWGIYNNLADGAVGLVEVPNFDMMLKNKLFSEFTSDHLLYFTKAALTNALELNGFEVIKCDTIWHDYIISAVVKKRSKLDISDFAQKQAKLKKEIENYIGRFKKVAVWGAGHQALAIIALMNLAGKIKYVIDSAPFKQGKYTPATHIPIVSQDALKRNPVDAVIVMAAGYSDEVAKIIRKKYGKNINVAILRDFGIEII